MELRDSTLFRQQAYINGEWVEADSGAAFEVINPATGAVLGSVPEMGMAEIRRTIEVAETAWEDWLKKNSQRAFHDIAQMA